MINSVILINLFFVPVLPLYLCYKSCRKPLTPSLELLFQYCIAVSLNHVAAHVISLLILKLTGAGFSLDSARYTLIAVISALLLYLVYFTAKYLKLEVRISEPEKTNGEDEKHETQKTP